jgi:hypothetical protein
MELYNFFFKITVLGDVWDMTSSSVVEFHGGTFCRSLKIEAIDSSEILITFYQMSLQHIPEDSNLDGHRRENLKARFFHRHFIAP